VKPIYDFNRAETEFQSGLAKLSIAGRFFLAVIKKSKPFQGHTKVKKDKSGAC
jgi:hypothetical protein